ncbi:megakaryocyte and platelet inhibitory receptor G6b [Homo sapiens]|uniref:Megakaryocyte and platelet inhibitory receptor G6b n=1 Tax=Homo sapiens TaxID=9606 RepID=F8WDG3_HUMAN|nr:megakaryocyte and platelet inhibitory receptor G6b [Homo sapiens]KAI4017629.1 megakaryocyte and platelet inhibitory receptor G6b [Homo sapiens]
MAVFLQLLPLLLSRAQGNPGASLDGRPGDRVNLSCGGVSHPIRWVWAPSFPACKGLSKGRRPILWASSSGTPTVPPLQPFVGRLRSLDSAPDPAAGRWVGARTGSFGPGLVAAQAPAPATDSTTP